MQEINCGSSFPLLFSCACGFQTNLNSKAGLLHGRVCCSLMDFIHENLSCHEKQGHRQVMDDGLLWGAARASWPFSAMPAPRMA